MVGTTSDRDGYPVAEYRHPVWLVLGWIIATAAVGAVIWVVYVLIADPVWPACGGYEGGAAAGGSLLTATAFGIGLLVLVGSVALWLRRMLALLFGASIGVFLAGLVVLWFASPLIWGPRICT
jgi:hypothetical protein